MLKQVDKNIWVDEQPLKYWGLEVGTRMTLIRLTSGELIVISPIKVDNITIAQINEIGNVTFIIAPNLYHHLFVSDFKAIYPEAKLWVVPGLELKRPELPIDKVFNENEGNIDNQVKYVFFEGFNISDKNGATSLNEFVFFHQESQTLVLTDIAFHFDDSFPLKTQLAARLIGSYKQLRPSILEKFAMKEKEKVKQSVQKILSWDFRRVIMAHGSIIENDGKKKLKQGYEWFVGCVF